MTTLLIIYLIGAIVCFVGSLIYFYNNRKEITLKDIVAAFMFSSLSWGMVFLFALQLGDSIVIYKKKK